MPKIPETPLYDPNIKVLKFNNEDFDNIRENQKGKDKLWEDPNFYYFIGEDIVWKRPNELCKRPYFIKGTPDRFDVNQGQLGDCWFVAGMQSLTLVPELFDHVVPQDQSFDENYDGVFHFRIWQCGAWYDIVVDDRLPVRVGWEGLRYAHSREGDVFWCALLEKAYAKYYGSYDALTAGACSSSMQDLTGGITERIYTFDPPPGLTISWFLTRVFSQNAMLCCSVNPRVKGVRDDLTTNHSYGITRLFKCEDDDPDYPGLFLIRLRNPVGYHEWTGDWSDYSSRWKTFNKTLMGEEINLKVEEDGEFWMVESDFLLYFQLLYICHLGPGQYLASRRITRQKHWRTISFMGEWIAGENAGGSDIETRHLNPQYFVSLQDINTPRDGRCTVLIALTHNPAVHDRNSVHRIGFYVYSLKSESQLSKPLDYDFFKNRGAKNRIIMREDKSFFRYFRDVVARKNLEPGNYCIVPCTYEKDEEAIFVLRVYTESTIDTWEYDPKISKRASIPKEATNVTDETIINIFQDVAGGQLEVDWISLQVILDRAMNKSTSSIIATNVNNVFNFIMRGLNMFLNISSSKDSHTVVFSKDTCRSMIAMLDKDRSGKLSFSEFEKLWRIISFWRKIYNAHSTHTEGYLTVPSLGEALSASGFNLDKNVLSVLVRHYADEQDRISLEDFIICGVNLQTAMDSFEEMVRDTGKELSFTMDEWAKSSLYL